MSRRLGYGRVVSDATAQQVTARLRLAGCVHVVVDRGTGEDPQPEWRKLRAALRPTDTLVIATLPTEGKHRRRVLGELHALSSATTCRVEILPGARLAHPGHDTATGTSDATAAQLSAGQLYRYHRPHRS